MDHSAGESFLQIFKEAPDGMLLADGSGRYVEVNDAACAMFGYTREEFLGMSAQDLLDPSEAPRLAELRRRALRVITPVSAEWMARRKDGTRMAVQVNVRVLSNGFACAIVRDVTARRERERMHDEWNAIVAHDMRDPMLAVALHAEHLAKHMPEGSSLLDSVRHIQAAATRAQRMITDLLDFSRLEARQLRLSLNEIDLPSAVKRAVDLVTPRAPDRVFHLRSEPEVRLVLADADRVAQVLDNLLSNAIKYGAPRTPIDVQVEAAGTHVAVSVENQGPGLSASLRSTLFQRFQRGAQGELQGIEGVGLGLYIARELVEAHDGELFVESTPRGTTAFRFTLPAA